MVLDPFASVFIGDENDTGAMNHAKAHLEELARVNARALLVLCHHTSKAGERGDGGPGMYAAPGSSILSGWADVQLNLKHQPAPKGSGRVVFIATVEKNRDGERGYKARVAISLGDGGHGMRPNPTIPPSAEPLLWTVANVARELQCSTSAVYKWAERGELPCRRLGALLRFVPAEVRAWALGEPPTGNVSPLRRLPQQP